MIHIYHGPNQSYTQCHTNLIIIRIPKSEMNVLRSEAAHPCDY